MEWFLVLGFSGNQLLVVFLENGFTAFFFFSCDMGPFHFNPFSGAARFIQYTEYIRCLAGWFGRDFRSFYMQYILGSLAENVLHMIVSLP